MRRITSGVFRRWERQERAGSRTPRGTPPSLGGQPIVPQSQNPLQISSARHTPRPTRAINIKQTRLYTWNGTRTNFGCCQGADQLSEHQCSCCWVCACAMKRNRVSSGGTYALWENIDLSQAAHDGLACSPTARPRRVGSSLGHSPCQAREASRPCCGRWPPSRAGAFVRGLHNRSMRSGCICRDCPFPPMLAGRKTGSGHAPPV